MEEDSALAQDDTLDPSPSQSFPVVAICDDGDVILDVTFETSGETIVAARKTWQTASKKAGASRALVPNLSPSIRVAYRVKLSVLRAHSRYFENLLGNKQFVEASHVEETLALLAAEKLKAAEVDPKYLPWITIVDDDEATRSVGRENVFENLLRILHGKRIQSTTVVDMHHVTTLAILADRFDCQSLVSRYLGIELKFKWPPTSAKATREGGQKKALDVENLLRQKILAVWLLEQAPRLRSSTRELVLRGSVRWGSLSLDEESPRTELWWNLPDGLERELQYRRECVLNTIASVHRHFIALYCSRERQCKLGYDSSSACDSFQLGQMLKFFSSKELMGIVDFGPSSYDNLRDYSVIDIEEILALLKQAPGYQIDKYHVNCGIRTRLEPIVEFIRLMLSSTALSISQSDWQNKRMSVSWFSGSDVVARLDNKERKFEFTRVMASYQRFRLDGYVDEKMVREVFTSAEWDWTPDYC